MSDRLTYSNAKIRRILNDVSTIAMVGASPTWNRPSYFAMKYLQEKGFRVIPVNPRAAGGEILGERVYASLTEAPGPIDMVQIFRNSEAAGPLTDPGCRCSMTTTTPATTATTSPVTASGTSTGRIRERCFFRGFFVADSSSGDVFGTGVSCAR